jgi:hypothetical protein
MAFNFDQSAVDKIERTVKAFLRESKSAPRIEHGLRDYPNLPFWAKITAAEAATHPDTGTPIDNKWKYTATRQLSVMEGTDFNDATDEPITITCYNVNEPSPDSDPLLPLSVGSLVLCVTEFDTAPPDTATDKYLPCYNFDKVIPALIVSGCGLSDDTPFKYLDLGPGILGSMADDKLYLNLGITGDSYITVGTSDCDLTLSLNTTSLGSYVTTLYGSLIGSLTVCGLSDVLCGSTVNIDSSRHDYGLVHVKGTAGTHPNKWELCNVNSITLTESRIGSDGSGNEIFQTRQTTITGLFSASSTSWGDGNTAGYSDC